MLYFYFSPRPCYQLISYSATIRYNTILMSQEQLELRLLHQKHLENMLNLEKQRQLLARQNPYKTSPPTLQDQFLPHPKNTPLLKPDPFIQKLLYYPPSEGESKVADRVMQSILSNWNRDCENIPESIHNRNMLKGSDKALLSKQLTARGQQQIEEMVAFSRKDDYKKTITIREKYSKHPNHPLFGLNSDRQPTRERYNL